MKLQYKKKTNRSTISLKRVCIKYGAMAKQCIIELQAFRGNKGEFIIKELAFMDLNTNVINHFLFKAPFPFSTLGKRAAKTNRWLMKNFHHITWNEGFIEYSELDTIMIHYCRQYQSAYTSGLEKSKWIERYMSGKCVNHCPVGRYESMVGGFCTSVLSPSHKTKNCVLVRIYALCKTLQKTIFDGSSGGGISGGGYKCYISATPAVEEHDCYVDAQDGNITFYDGCST